MSGPGAVPMPVEDRVIAQSDVKAAVVAERRELVDMLAALDPSQWDSPTLCAGWCVREVVAHITQPFRYSFGRFALEMVRSRGRFNAMADRTARRDADDLSASDLLGALRENVEHDWKPPGGGFEGALSHDVIHGLDISVGLGIGRTVPTERMGIVLGSMKPKQVKFFGVDLEGIELRADDLDFGYGNGRLVSGAAQDLLLVICGRLLPGGHLRGEDSWRFTRS